MEAREVDGAAKALGLIKLFVNKFRSIDFTSHPGDIPGEAAGKGSNLAWAARKLSAKYAIGMRRDVIITGIDGEFSFCFSFCSHSIAMMISVFGAMSCKNCSSSWITSAKWSGVSAEPGLLSLEVATCGLEADKTFCDQ